MTDKKTLFTIKELTRGYPENTEKVFENFNFSIKHGEFHILMGKSGKGKTTLVKLLIGELIAPRGTIFFGDDDIANYSPIDRENYRKQIGIIFQDYRLFDKASVKENIATPLKIFGLGPTIIETKTENMIKKCNLRHITSTPIQRLSAGEKQKICLARALIHNPEYIIADEPTGNLDREHTQEVADILIEANKQGNTILLITHDIHLVNYLKSKHRFSLDMLD